MQYVKDLERNNEQLGAALEVMNREWHGLNYAQPGMKPAELRSRALELAIRSASPDTTTDLLEERAAEFYDYLEGKTS